MTWNELHPENRETRFERFKKYYVSCVLCMVLRRVYLLIKGFIGMNTIAISPFVVKDKFHVFCSPILLLFLSLSFFFCFYVLYFFTGSFAYIDTSQSLIIAIF